MEPTCVHIGIRATNLDETIYFWRDLLGLEVVAEGENHFDLTDGYHNFRLFEYAGDDRAPHLGGLDDYLHIGVYVDDLQASIDRFEEGGFEPFVDDVTVGDPYDPENPPEESYMIEDPDGIVLDVSDNPNQWPGADLLDERVE